MNKSVSRIVSLAASATLAGAVLVTAPAAPSEAATVWIRVATCESSGNWKINTGNGYYGGLQFSAATWRGFGGTKSARYAHQATKAQQIAIAKRVLAVQGPGAWPVCSKRAGLTKANGGASTKATAASSTRTRTPSRSTSVSRTSSSASKYVTVRSGDTLGRIAARYGVKGGWRGLWKLNASKVKNPNRIYIGQRLAVR